MRPEPLVFALDVILRAAQRSHVGFRRPRALCSDLLAAGFAEVDVSTRWLGSYAFVRAREPD